MLTQFAVIKSVTEMEGWAVGLGDCMDAGMAAPIKPEGLKSTWKCLGDDVIVADDIGVMDVYSFQSTSSLSYSSACSWGSHFVNTSRKLVWETVSHSIHLSR